MRSGWGRTRGVVMSLGNEKVEERKRERGGTGGPMTLDGFGVWRDQSR